MVTVNTASIESFLHPSQLTELEPQLQAAWSALWQGTGVGGEFLGWRDLPENYDRIELQRIQAAAKRIQSDSQVLVVIGIGGSYLGSRAVIELLQGAYYNLKQKNTPDIFFAGNTLSGEAVLELLEVIGERDFSINVISKSGTTTEPAVAFRIFRAVLEARYGKAGAARRIYATTDRQKGALKTMADAEGYESFVVPDDIGGRYSVLTAVGLLPMAVTGIDIAKLLEGAADGRAAFQQAGMDNPVWQYAAARNALYQAGKKIEILGCYEPSFRFMAEWWKQLFGESEGKQGKGIFPASVEFTADLHSMGQYIQEGERLLFETIVDFRQPRRTATVPAEDNDLDGLNFLAGKELKYLCDQAMMGTKLAHVDGGVPNVFIQIPCADAYHVGALIYFFELACGLSGYLLCVNPFDQPGVEAYKKNMFALLGKPGYEALGEALRQRL